MKNGILILLIILSTTVFLKTNEALAQTETKNILIEAAETIVSKEMEQRKKTIADYQQDLKSKEEQIKILEEILKKTDKSLITIATIIDKNIRDTNATFVFNTNNFGKISARAISINGNIPVPGSESDYGIEHRIEFAGLTPGRTYSLEINAILPSGGESKVDISIDSEKSFSTSTDMQAPTVFFTKNDSPASPGQVEIKYSTEQRVQIEISCKKIVPGLEIIECARGNFGKIELTKSGRSVVSANYYSGTGTITVDKLEADSVYAFSGRAVNERGIERKIQANLTYKTSAFPTSVDFSGPILFDIFPDKTLVTWKWTGQPKESTVRLKIGPNSEVIFKNIKPDTATQTSSAEIPVSEIFKKLNERDAAGQNYRPVIVVEMKDGANQEIAREFSFVIALPSKSKKNSLSEEQKKELKRVTELIPENEEKINWKQIIKMGLSVFFAFIP